MNLLNIDYKKDIIKKIICVLIAVFIYAFNIKAFVYNANLISSGISGLSIFIRRLLIDFLNITLPLTMVNIILNIIPVIISWIIVGKKFTIISFVIVNLMTIVSDIMPVVNITNDMLVSAMFAGILNGFSLGLVLRVGLSSGGTDFISIAVAKKYHFPIFNYVMIFNILIICIQGMIYGFEQALYSIVYQFITTQIINYLYKHFEKRTLFIITNNPQQISDAIIKNTNHTVTQIDCLGAYSGKGKYMLYVLVTEPELKFVLHLIKSVDENSFINVMKSTEVRGNFNYLPVSE